MKYKLKININIKILVLKEIWVQVLLYQKPLLQKLHLKCYCMRCKKQIKILFNTDKQMKNNPKQKNLGINSARAEGPYFIKKRCFKS